LKNSDVIKYLIYALFIVLSFGSTIGQTYFKVKDCSLEYIKMDTVKGDSASGKISTIKNISNISFGDTVSILINTSKGKSLAVEYKNAKQLTILGQNNVGKITGYGALIGLGIFGSLSIPLGGYYILAGGAFGAGLGALIGLIIGGAGNEPDILNLSVPLTNTEKRNMTIKFLKRITF